MFKQILLVAVGGAAGSVLRLLVGMLVSRYAATALPIGTLAVNMAGCFLIGWLMGWLPPGGPDSYTLRWLLVTGFCGGFTTFSAFAYENITLIQQGQTAAALGYVFASVAGGILAVWAGLKLAGA